MDLPEHTAHRRVAITEFTVRRIVFATLFRRVPGLRLAAEIGDLPFKHGAIVYGLHELPVSW